jgi:hypothetical protein
MPCRDLADAEYNSDSHLGNDDRRQDSLPDAEQKAYPALSYGYQAYTELPDSDHAPGDTYFSVGPSAYGNMYQRIPAIADP